MKTLLSLLSVAVLSATFSTAAKTDQDIAKLQREVTIFQRVVSTALKHDTQGQVQNVEGYYLADQGLVFDVSLRGKSMFDWRKHIEGMRDLHGFSEIPSPDFSSLEKQMSELSDNLADVSKEAYQVALEAVRQGAEQIREVAEQERETRRELHELERAKQELNYMLKRQNEKDKELEQHHKDIAKQIAQLEAEKAKLAENKTQLKERLEKDKQKRQAQQQAQQELLRTTVTMSLANSLCDYGNGLRGVSENEHVSFKFSPSYQQEKHILVFKKSDIESCVKGKINAEKLAKRATQYAF